VGIAWLWHRVVAKALAATIAVFVLFSLGPTLLAAERNLGIPLPWILVHRIPPLDSVLPTRFGMVVIPLFGAVLAMIIDRIGQLKDSAQQAFPVRRTGYLAVALALVPMIPTPIPADPVPGTPSFIMSGAWKDYVPAGHTLVPVPDTSPDDPLAMVWLAESDGDFAIPGGYFIGPARNGRGVYGADPVRPTQALLKDVAQHGYAPLVTDEMRRQLREDLAFWKASVLVMPDNIRYAENVRSFVNELTGQTGTRVQDVTVWRTLDLAGHGG
jgi:dolichyl-phosphate beta-glucosyltransferase